MGWICLSLGASLVFWGLPSRLLATAAVPSAGSAGADRPSVLRIVQTGLTPTPRYNPTATPPTQSGHGHAIFYIYCSSCHGDVGQGLTDEYRLRAYPPEDVDCWKSGCHGARPYENGFILPKTVPALIGPGTLTKFATARNVFDFMRAAMPFNKPGSLSEEQYLQLLAYLLEQNNFVPTGTRLDVNTLQQIGLRPEQVPAPTASAAAGLPDGSSSIVIAGILLLGIVVLAVLIVRRLSRQAPH